MYKLIPAVGTNWDNIFLLAMQVYQDAYERAANVGNNTEDARRIATTVLLQKLDAIPLFEL